MIYSNLWRYCVSTREFPAKFIKPRRRKSRAKRALAKKNSPLKRSPLLPPEKPESEPGKPPIKPYLEDLTRRKRIVRSLKRRRTISRSQEEAQSHTTPSKFPTYKKGHFHLLQDGYIDFINSSYQNSRAVLSRWDVEQAWAGLVRGKFEEWRSEKRLKERLFKALGKAISKIDTSVSRKCFLWWERIQRRRALKDTKAGIDAKGATRLPTLIQGPKIPRKRRLSTTGRELLKTTWKVWEGAKQQSRHEGT